jgi:23S rRNA (guanosine2251-2'-O)-methyltransferase
MITSRLNSSQLRTTLPSEKDKLQIKRNPIYLILDNVLDTYNIGSLFRLADAVSAEKIFLCGECEIPPHTRITKAAIDTDKWVPWEYCKTAFDAVEKLKKQGVQIVSLEQSEKSVAYDKAEYKFPVAIVSGNETYGVSQEVLDASDIVAEIPMHGINVSLNVVVSSGILVYEILKKLPAVIPAKAGI